MKLLPPLAIGAVCVFGLTNCNENGVSDQSSNTFLDQQQDIAAQAESNAAQMAEMAARGQALQAEIAELKLKAQEDQNFALQEKLAAIQQENDRLMAEAEAARVASEGLNRSLSGNGGGPRYDYPATLGYGDSDLRSGTENRYGYAPPGPEPGGHSWQEPDADYSVFYQDLSPHGQWLELEGYGYGYRPNVSQRTSWRPYEDGRWVWSDHGWAWDSPEPFGWACYHYGRWVQLSRIGWVWIPGREWAPAWVSWRSNGDYLGWAPLPPTRRHDSWIGDDCDVHYGLAPNNYVFIEMGNFNRSSYYGNCLSTTVVNRVFSLTINVTNITSVNQRNSHVFHNHSGPDRGWLEKRLGRQVAVAQLEVRDHYDRRDHDWNSRDGIRPLIAAPLPESGGKFLVKPEKVAGKVSDIAVVDGWSGITKDKKEDFQKLIVRQAEVSEPGTNVAGESIPGVDSFREAALDRKRQFGGKGGDKMKGAELSAVGDRAATQADMERELEDMRRQQADVKKAQQDLLKEHEKVQKEAAASAEKSKGDDSKEPKLQEILDRQMEESKVAQDRGKKDLEEQKMALENQNKQVILEMELAKKDAAAFAKASQEAEEKRQMAARQAEELTKQKSMQEEAEASLRKRSEEDAKRQESAKMQQQAQQEFMAQQQKEAAQREAMAQQGRKNAEEASRQQQKEAAQREAMAEQSRKNAEDAMKQQQQGIEKQNRAAQEAMQKQQQQQQQQRQQQQQQQQQQKEDDGKKDRGDGKKRN